MMKQREAEAEGTTLSLEHVIERELGEHAANIGTELEIELSDDWEHELHEELAGGVSSDQAT